MQISKILINALVVVAISLLVAQRVFLALTSPWMDFLLIGASVLCLFVAFVIHWVAGEDAKPEATTNDQTGEKNAD